LPLPPSNTHNFCPLSLSLSSQIADLRQKFRQGVFENLAVSIASAKIECLYAALANSVPVAAATLAPPVAPSSVALPVAGAVMAQTAQPFVAHQPTQSLAPPPTVLSAATAVAATLAPAPAPPASAAVQAPAAVTLPPPGTAFASAPSSVTPTAEVANWPVPATVAVAAAAPVMAATQAKDTTGEPMVVEPIE